MGYSTEDNALGLFSWAKLREKSCTVLMSTVVESLYNGTQAASFFSSAIMSDRLNT